ncbi:MAG: ATP-dependent DNA helicase RecG [Acholeplasmatales bacterium]|nr:ATP-dependent DNA helicase RecG [Acholeplasmatales bacterium]
MNVKDMQIRKSDGIGPKTFQILKDNNINTIFDLINIFPTRYLNFMETGLEQDNVFIKCTVFTLPKMTFVKKNLSYMTFDVTYKDRIVRVTIFNRNYLEYKIKENQVIYVTGKFEANRNNIIASNIYFSLKEDSFEPVYDFNQIPSKTLKKIINNVLDKYSIYIHEELPEYLLKRYNLPDIYTAYKYIHNPSSELEYQLAYKRFKYEEFLTFELKLQYIRQINRTSLKTPKKWDINVIRDFIKTIPFELTDSQKEVSNEIYKDLKSNYPMNRLVQGDVGSGKTIVAALAIYAVALDNYEVCFMAPTEILAYQHYENLSNLFKDTKIRIEVLTSSIKGKTRKELLDKIKNHEVDVIIGTHALFTDDIIYDNLGLVITDEQHRFGVKQRQALREKGFNPDVLYLTATPIPRTLAISLFGDMDSSIIKQMPNGRKKVKTKVVLEDNLDACLSFLSNELDNGHQAYVISPLIEESDKMDLHDVYKTYDLLKEKLPNYKMEILHGKMKQTEKDEIMNRFKNKEFNLLISTTVIEVGIDNPNATVMMIFNAERFGLSQLHQLRGRVGRSNLESFCFLITDDTDKARLKIIEETTDGFKLAEEDLKLRGPGDFFGLRQSGVPKFKFGDLIQDYRVLENAKNDAYDLVFNIGLDRYVYLKDKVNKEINSIKD